MNCRDVREVGDSFLCQELLTETNHEILRHLDSCPSCRTEIALSSSLSLVLSSWAPLRRSCTARRDRSLSRRHGESSPRRRNLCRL